MVEKSLEERGALVCSVREFLGDLWSPASNLAGRTLREEDKQDVGLCMDARSRVWTVMHRSADLCLL